MAAQNPQNVLSTLVSELAEARSDINGDGVSTRLQSAMQDNLIAKNTLSYLRDTLAVEKEKEIFLFKQEQERLAAEQEAAAKQQRLVDGITRQAQATFLQGRDQEDIDALRGTPFEQAWVEAELGRAVTEAAQGDLLNEDAQSLFAAAQVAQQNFVGQRLAAGVSDEAMNAYKRGINFDEVYANRNDSDFGPIDFLRNAAGSAVSGIGGAVDLGLSAIGLGALGNPIGDAAQSIGSAIDNQSLGSAIFQERLAESGAEGFTEGLGAGLEALTPGAAVGIGADILGLIGGGGPIAAGARGAARLAGGASQNVARAGQLLQRGGAPALVAGAGQDFAQNGIEGDNLGRTVQAQTQILGTLGLGALAGTALGGQIIGGIEGAAAQGGLRGVLGGQLSRAAPTGSIPQRLAAEAGERSLAGASGAITRGASEGLQEGAETVLSQAALSAGTGENQFDATETGSSVGLGLALGGGLGAGRAFQSRAEAPPGAAPSGTDPLATDPTGTGPSGTGTGANPNNLPVATPLGLNAPAQQGTAVVNSPLGLNAPAQQGLVATPLGLPQSDTIEGEFEILADDAFLQPQIPAPARDPITQETVNALPTPPARPDTGQIDGLTGNQAADLASAAGASPVSSGPERGSEARLPGVRPVEGRAEVPAAVSERGVPASDIEFTGSVERAPEVPIDVAPTETFDALDSSADSRVTIDTLYDALSSRDVPRAVRMARLLLSEGEYNLDDLLDAAYHTDNEGIQRVYSNRIRQMAQDVGGTNSVVPNSAGGLRARKQALEREISALQQAGNYAAVSPLQAQLNDINETLTEQALPSEQEINSFVNTDSVGRAPTLGEPQLASLRESSEADVRPATATVPQRIEFNPSVDLELVDARAEPDIPATSRKDTNTNPQMQLEGDTLDHVRKRKEFEKVEAAEPTLNAAINDADVMAKLGADLRAQYGNAISKVSVARIGSTTAGVFSRGAVAVNDFISRTPQAAYVIAHELGHASHSLLGQELNTDATLRSELDAVEKQLYPGLRRAVQRASQQGKDINAAYYNYLLSNKELIAEFNAMRMIDPATAKSIAPGLTAKMEQAAKTPNLIVKRGTHPAMGGLVQVPSQSTMTFTRDGLSERRSSERRRPQASRSATDRFNEGNYSFTEHPHLAASATARTMVQADPTISGEVLSDLLRRRLLNEGMNEVEANAQALHYGRVHERFGRQSPPQSRVLDRDSATHINRQAKTRPSRVFASHVAPVSDTSSSGPSLVRRMRPQAIRARLSKLLGKYPYKVIQSRDELTPEFIAKLKEDTGYDWDDGIKAVIYGNEVFVNAANITDEFELDAVMAHEILGHAGLRAAFGPRLEQHFNDVLTSYGSLDAMLEAADRMGLGSIRQNYAALISRARTEGMTGPSARVIAEEIITGIVERGGLDARRAGLLERIGATVRSWMRMKFPKLAKAMDLGFADWELGVMAGEASHAGRSLLDGAQPVNTARAFAARRVPFAERARQYATKSGREAQEFAQNIINSKAPASQTFAGTANNVRQTLRNVREGDNAYNRFVKQFTNHRRELQNKTRQIRRNLMGDMKAVTAAVATIWDGANLDSIDYNGKSQEETQRAIVDRFFKKTLGDGKLDPEATSEKLIDMMALYERIQLSEYNADREHANATKELDGDLRAALSLIAEAMPGVRVDQRAAVEFYDGIRRDMHAIERNNAFFYDYRHNRKLKNFLDKDQMTQLKAIRRRIWAKDSSALTPSEAFAQEIAFIDANISELDMDAFVELRDELTLTSGPDSSTKAANARLDALNISEAEQNAIDVMDSVMDRYLELDLETKKSYGAASRDYTDAIDRYGFKHYSPQWVKDKDHDNTFDLGQGVYDPMMSTFEAAQGTQKETVSPLAAITTMVNRTFHDAADNDIKADVIAVWAAAHNADLSATFDSDWSNGRMQLVSKDSKEYRKAMSAAKKNVFVHHLSDIDPELAAATSRGEQNALREKSPDSYALILTYDPGSKKRKESPIPELVKGRREQNAMVKQLRESDNVLANILTSGARTMGSMHTKYDPAWPVIQLIRDTLAAFVTVGAEEGFAGAKDFVVDGLGGLMASAPKISKLLYHMDGESAASQKKARELMADPELREFMEFINSGAPSPFSQSISIDARMDQLSESLRTRGLTTKELGALGEADRAITLLSSMTDVVGRYAAYKAFRQRGYSKQQAASASRDVADFGQRGASQYADLGSMGYMFFRSGMIGATQIIDTLLASKYNLETLGLATGIAGGMFAMAAMISPEDEEGNNLFLTQGNSTTHFKMFIDEDTIVQIPYSYNGFVAAGAATMQALYGLTGNQSFASTASNIADVVINNVTPVSNNIGITDTQGNVDLTQVSKKVFDLASPTLAGPFLGLAMNVNNFGNPIVPADGSVADPGTIGAVFDSSGSQIGGAAEVLSRAVFEATDIPISVRQTHYLLNEMANGPTAIVDMFLEWNRMASGREYNPDWKKAATPFAGVIGSPYNSQNEQFYEKWNRLSDVDKSLRILKRTGMSEEDALARVTEIVGEDIMNNREAFNAEATALRSTGTEQRDLRLSNILHDTERLTRYKEGRREYDASIGALMRNFEDL